MFDYSDLFESYCKENSLNLTLSFVMPSGYETANGTFETVTKTVFINADLLRNSPDYEKAFFLFHELRHASQNLCPEKFSDMITRSIQYIIMYDGTCYKIIDGDYHECKLDGSAEYFTNIYLGQPYEVDANTFAYEQVKNIYGDSEDLRNLFNFWMPRESVSDDLYLSVYDMIDEKTGS